MKPTQKRTYGRSGLEVTAMGLGTAPLGNQFRFVPDADARAVTDGAWDAGLRYSTQPRSTGTVSPSFALERR